MFFLALGLGMTSSRVLRAVAVTEAIAVRIQVAPLEFFTTLRLPKS